MRRIIVFADVKDGDRMLPMSSIAEVSDELAERLIRLDLAAPAAEPGSPAYHAPHRIDLDEEPS